MLSTPAPVRVWEHSFAIYRRIWRSNVLGGFVQPLLYLIGMGLGVGALVDSGANSLELLDGLSYFAFIAPALLATTAMMVSSQEAMWPVVESFMWSYSYRSMAATPLTPGQIVSGVALWQATRAAISVAGVADRVGVLRRDAFARAAVGDPVRRAHGSGVLGAADRRGRRPAIGRRRSRPSNGS